ncbi:putative 4-hydroxy-2-oxoglutarate aldolase [Fusarium oxysporum f. sp. rapae]|uniref:Putative 4-hydroxy-2-oxoglutarate aldolase n=1 Tax=Fusarium oxysporum f. sp. rapae TaxID=485398 RepID=A0A8J5P1J3_FUSOX|nr:putative 4-hydroxy-2-oxoglutarate aldolase [Fusarium oxysporum f. sp. rapae]
MMSRVSGPPPHGVYAPVITFFGGQENVDFDSIAKHVQRLLKAGITGLVVHGSNGEATHLSDKERVEIISYIRSTANLFEQQTPIIAGCSSNSVRQTLELISQAQLAGADYALVLPPSYWAAAMTKPIIKSFYRDVAAESKLPVIIYNFPNVASGIDIDSDLIVELARELPNISGVKLTCGNLGKLQRVTAAITADKFSAFAGKADFMLPGLVCGSAGVIAALANVVPRVHVELLRAYSAGDLERAAAIQKGLSCADAALLKFGISGVKTSCRKWFGYGDGRVRRPLPTVELSSMDGDAVQSIERLIELENSLVSGSPNL